MEAIVSIAESGRPDIYSAIAAAKNDRGGLSYGKHQASLTSGNLHKLISRYCEAPEAIYAADLKPFLPAMQAKDRVLDDNAQLKGILKRAGDSDPVMTKVQDDFFFEMFMQPAIARAKSYGLQNALSYAVFYDSWIHGSFDAIFADTVKAMGGAQPSPANEKAWIAKYVDTRLAWLNSVERLKTTAIRQEALKQLIEQGKWDLGLPFDLKRPNSIYPMSPFDLPAYLFPDPLRRLGAAAWGALGPRKGVVVVNNLSARFVQDSLIKLDLLDGKVDGNFGAGTADAVKKFQKSCGVDATGIVNAATFDKLCDRVAAIDGLKQPGPAAAGKDGFVVLPPKKKSATQVTAGSAGVTVAVATGATATALGGQETQPDAGSAAHGPATSPTDTPPPAPNPGTPPATGANGTPQDPAATPTSGSTASPPAASPPPAKTPPPSGVNAQSAPGAVVAKSHYDLGPVKIPTDAVALGLAAGFVIAVVLFCLSQRKSY